MPPALPVLRGICSDERDFDLIDAHYFYPDGVAAALLGRALGKPVVITARGTDVNLDPAPRAAAAHDPLGRRAGRRGVITVAEALKDALVELGVAGAPVTVLRNGVDLELFRPGGRATARAELGLDGPDSALGRPSDRAQGPCI